MDALLHRPFPCPSLRVREGCGSDSHGRGTTTSPMGIRYPIPIRRGGLEGFHPSISAEPSGQGRGAAADGERRLSDVRMQVGEETDRLECLRQRADGVARDVAELEPIAADVRRFEGAGRAERGAILDSIAARCAGAARAARAAIEELGDRIWALMRPRKAKRTERDLDDVMRKATEVARATKALSRNHAPPRSSTC